jgi:hypothetical protein
VKLKDELLFLTRKLAHTEECIRDIQEAIVSKGVTVTLTTPLEQFANRIRMIMTPGDFVFAYFRSAFIFSDSSLAYDADARNKSVFMLSDRAWVTLESVDDWKKAVFRDVIAFEDNSAVGDLAVDKKIIVSFTDKLTVSLEDSRDWLRLNINEAVTFTDKVSEGYSDITKKSVMSFEDSLAVYLEQK